MDQAIEHALAAGEPDSASVLVLRYWESRLASGRLITILAWLGSFPEGYVEESGPLSVVKAWISGVLGQQSAARQSRDDVLRSGFDGILPDGSKTVRDAAALIRSMFPWADAGELRKAADEVRRFKDRLPAMSRAVATFTLGLSAFLGGEYENAKTDLQDASRLAEASGVWIVVIDALGFRAQVALNQGYLEEAENLALRLIDQARVHGL